MTATPIGVATIDLMRILPGLRRRRCGWKGLGPMADAAAVGVGVTNVKGVG